MSEEFQGTAQEWVSTIYISYWSRAADPAGQDYWVGEFDELEAVGIADNFSNQPEARTYELFAAYQDGEEITSDMREAFIDAVYANLFNREPDEEGKAYWVEKMEEGEATPGVMLANIVNAALVDGGEDAATIIAKKDVAAAVTAEASAKGWYDEEAAIEYLRSEDAKAYLEDTTTDNVEQQKKDAIENVPLYEAPIAEDTITTQDAPFDTTDGTNMVDGESAEEDVNNTIILAENEHTTTSVLDGVGGTNTLEFGVEEDYLLADLDELDEIDYVDTGNIEYILRVSQSQIDTLGEGWLGSEKDITLRQVSEDREVNLENLVRTELEADEFQGLLGAGFMQDGEPQSVIYNPPDDRLDERDAFHGDSLMDYDDLVLKGKYSGIEGYSQDRDAQEETRIVGDEDSDPYPALGLMNIHSQDVTLDGLSVEYDTRNLPGDEELRSTIEVEPWGDNYSDGSAQGTVIQNLVVQRVGGYADWQASQAIGVRESEVTVQDNLVQGSDGAGGRSTGQGILVADGRYPWDLEDYFDDLDPEEAANDVQDTEITSNVITGFDAGLDIFDKNLEESALEIEVQGNYIGGNRLGMEIKGNDLLPFTSQAEITGNDFGDVQPQDGDSLGPNQEADIWITGAGGWGPFEGQAEIDITENDFHDSTDAVRIGGQYDNGIISIRENDLNSDGSQTSSIAFGLEDTYGFSGTGTIEFEPQEEDVLEDGTFDFSSLLGIDGFTEIVMEEVDELDDIEQGADDFFADEQQENIVAQTDGSDSRIFVNEPEEEQGQKGDELSENDLQVDVIGVSDMDEFENAISTTAGHFEVVDIQPGDFGPEPEMTATIENTGEAQATQDIVLEGGDSSPWARYPEEPVPAVVVEFEEAQELSLGAGETSEVEFQIQDATGRVPPNLGVPATSYPLKVSTQNHEATPEPGPLSLNGSELDIVSVEIDSPQPGEEFQVEVTVAEEADVETEGLEVYLSIQDTDIEETISPEPLQDGQVTVTFEDLKIQDPGQYTAEVMAGADNAVPGLEENLPAWPLVEQDFQVSGSHFEIQDIDVDLPPEGGGAAEVTASIENTGDAGDTQDVELEVWEDTYLVYEDVEPLHLEAGESGEVAFSEELEEPHEEYYSMIIKTEDDQHQEDIPPPNGDEDFQIQTLGIKQDLHDVNYEGTID